VLVIDRWPSQPWIARVALVREGVTPQHVRVRIEADAHTILVTPQKNGSGPWVTR
jgi:hypothetical protein